MEYFQQHDLTTKNTGNVSADIIYICFKICQNIITDL